MYSLPIEMLKQIWYNKDHQVGLVHYLPLNFPKCKEVTATVEDIRSIIARNITELRKKRSMTQLELAERLNYSDKAISKWERGESVPDITVLKSIADLFDVTVDYLITADHPEPTPAEPTSPTPRPKRSRRNYGFITGMCIMLVWLIATLLYVILSSALESSYGPLIPYAFAVPASMVVWLTMNSIWFNRRFNFLIISLLMWSILLAVYFCILLNGQNFPMIFILGIPGQIIILLWSGIKRKNGHSEPLTIKNETDKKENDNE